MNEALKPCPKCNMPAKMEQDSYSSYWNKDAAPTWAVSCGCIIWHETPEAAIEEWNKRYE